jgi:phage gp16-like protein
MTDTEARAEERWMEMVRQMTPAQRLARTWELSEAVRQMFLANIRHLDEDTQRRRLAEASYGPEAAERMYGR